MTNRSAFSGMHCTHVIAREDAVIHNGREYVPTIYGHPDQENTVWVSDIADLIKVGGSMRFNEDQTEITLTLPVRHKFSIGFFRSMEK